MSQTLLAEIGMESCCLVMWLCGLLGFGICEMKIFMIH